MMKSENRIQTKRKPKPQIREMTMQRGINFPSDEELVMMILGSGTKTLPLEEMSFKVCRVLCQTKAEKIIPELLKIQGIGHSKALAIASSLELGRRFFCHKGIKIKTPEDLIPFVTHYTLTKQEHFLSVMLSGANEIIDIHVASVGTVNYTVVHPREIFSLAVKENASSLIFCHNHPSGSVTPSNEDIETTRRLVEAGEIIGIPVIDHLILTQDSHFSFFEHGLLEGKK